MDVSEAGSLTEKATTTYFYGSTEEIRKQDTDCVGFEVLTAVVMKNPIFWNVTPCSPLKAIRRFGGICSSIATCFMLVSGLPYSSTLKMEATYSSETTVDFEQTTRRYIPDDVTLQDTDC
jgi:hypothetical protein